MKIYLIRHGESTSDVEDKYGGDYDDHLTEKGESQAKDLAKKFKGKGVEIIYSSPRFRAKETAEILSNFLDVPLKVMKDLKERNRYGVLTGMVKAEAKKRYPRLAEQVKDEAQTIEGAENFNLFKKRVTKVFKSIVKDDKYKTIAIVSHGGPLKAIFTDILKEIPPETFGDCGVVELEKKNGSLKLLNLSS